MQQVKFHIHSRAAATKYQFHIFEILINKFLVNIHWDCLGVVGLVCVFTNLCTDHQINAYREVISYVLFPYLEGFTKEILYIKAFRVNDLGGEI